MFRVNASRNVFTTYDPTSNDMKVPELTILIPVFNGEHCLPDTFRKLDRLINESELRLEVVFVDDGSRDRSFDLIKDFIREHEWGAALRLGDNYGMHSALRVGFEKARADFVATTEMCMENSPDELLRLFHSMNDSCDVVSGWRKRRVASWWRRIASKLINGFLRGVCNMPLHDINCLVKVWRKPVGRAVFRLPAYEHFLTELLSKRLTEVTFNYNKNYTNVPSSFSARQLFKIAASFFRAAWRIRTKRPPALETIIPPHIKIAEEVRGWAKGDAG